MNWYKKAQSTMWFKLMSLRGDTAGSHGFGNVEERPASDCSKSLVVDFFREYSEIRTLDSAFSSQIEKLLQGSSVFAQGKYGIRSYHECVYVADVWVETSWEKVQEIQKMAQNMDAGLLTTIYHKPIASDTYFGSRSKVSTVGTTFTSFSQLFTFLQSELDVDFLGRDEYLENPPPRKPEKTIPGMEGTSEEFWQKKIDENKPQEQYETEVRWWEKQQ